MILLYSYDNVSLKRNRQPNERLAISNNQHRINMSTASITLRDGSVSVNRGNRFIDKTGLKYGKLTVLKIDFVKNGNVRWMCRCECGIEKSILARALNQGQISCGCIRRENIIGKKYGSLTVLSDAGFRCFGKNNVKKPLWNCRCDCGNKTTATGESLRTGNKQSCGCLKKKAQLKSHFIHGMTMGGNRIREYRIWSNMKNRCSNPKSNRFHIYGGRGISVCKRWMKFENFFNDMGECPKGMSLERKDRNKNYEPENCKWATIFEQANNTSKNRFLYFNGQSLTVAQWARKVLLPYGCISERLKRGWSVEKTLTTSKI